MLSNFIGAIDWPAAAIVVAIAVTICIVATTYIGKYRRRVEIDNDFELSKIKQKDDQDLKMAKAIADRDFNMKRIDQGLITSHRVTSGGDRDDE